MPPSVKAGLAVIACLFIASKLPPEVTALIVVVVAVIAYFMKPPKGGGGDWTRQAKNMTTAEELATAEKYRTSGIPGSKDWS